MLYNDEYKEDYERRFNAYINKIIDGCFKNFWRSKQKEMMKISLNERLESGTELWEFIVGDEDVIYEERIIVSKLEDVMTDPLIRKAIKPLTYEEKLAVLLRYIEKRKSKDLAKILGYSDRSGVNKSLKKSLQKIRKTYKKGEVKND